MAARLVKDARSLDNVRRCAACLLLVLCNYNTLHCATRHHTYTTPRGHFQSTTLLHYITLHTITNHLRHKDISRRRGVCDTSETFGTLLLVPFTFMVFQIVGFCFLGDPVWCVVQLINNQFQHTWLSSSKYNHGYKQAPTRPTNQRVPVIKRLQ